MDGLASDLIGVDHRRRQIALVYRESVGRVVEYAAVAAELPRAGVRRAISGEKSKDHLVVAAAGRCHAFVKRVVGIGGDTVSWDAEDKLHVNGVRVEEPYLRQDSRIPKAFPLPLSATVPPGTVFVAGDWRDNSRDSRLYKDQANNGAIPLSAVVGTVVATDSGPLPQTRAFIDAGLATERVENPWPGRVALFGGIGVFLIGTAWLGLRLRKRSTE